MVLPQGFPWAFATFLTPSLLPCQLGAPAFVEQPPCSGMATLPRNNGEKQSINPKSMLWLNERLQLPAFPCQPAPTMPCRGSDVGAGWDLMLFFSCSPEGITK